MLMLTSSVLTVLPDLLKIPMYAGFAQQTTEVISHTFTQSTQNIRADHLQILEERELAHRYGVN